MSTCVNPLTSTELVTTTYNVMFNINTPAEDGLKLTEITLPSDYTFCETVITKIKAKK